MKSRNTFFEHHLNHRFNVQKNVSFLIKLTADQSIIFNRSETTRSKNLKIKNFIFESNLISTEKFIYESLNMKTKTLTQQFIFSIN